MGLKDERKSGMVLRKLDVSDYPDMLMLYRKLDELHVKARPDCFEYREDIYPKEHFEAAVKNEICFLMGAFDEQDTMVGFVRATLWNERGIIKERKTVCLDNIYVLPEYRREGIGTRLFNAVEKWAKEQGAVRLELLTWDFNKDAVMMYNAMGMTLQKYVFEKKL